MADREGACRVFRMATEYVRSANLHAEVEWQRSAIWGDFSESEFLREAAWVICCSGFREATVRKIFGYLSLCFCDWESAKAIVQDADRCSLAAQTVFRNDRKLDALICAARRVHEVGFSDLRNVIVVDPIVELQKFAFIGPTTCWHLAKNLGYDTAKPDRHLVRLAQQFGFESAFTLCDFVAREFDEQSKVVDLVLWRFIADNPSMNWKAA